MGFFSKKVTSVDSESLKLFEDTPNLVRDTVIAAVVADRPVAEDLVANYMNSISVKGDVMREYARREYYLGLPNGTREYVRADNTAVKLVIERNEGRQIYLATSTIEPCNPEYFCWDWLTTNRDWDYLTGEINSPLFPPFSPFYPVTVDTLDIISSSAIRVRYTWYHPTLIGNGYWEFAEETIPATGVMQAGALFYHCVYTYLDAAGNPINTPRFFNYNTRSNAEPMLLPPNGIVEESPYFPIVPLRENNVDLSDPSRAGTPQYDTSVACLNRMGLDFKDLGAAVNENPDIADVDHAYILIAVGLQSDNPITMKYLHNYFAYLADNSEYTKLDYDYWDNSDSESPPPMNKIEVGEGNLKFDIGWHYAVKTVEIGSVGGVGTVTRTNDVRNREVRSGDYQSYGWEVSKVTFKKQISSNRYEQVEVLGLIHVNHIYKGRTVETTVELSLSADNNDFWIPLNINVSKEMGLLDHNKLLYDAVRIVFNCWQTKKLKWYQSGFFQFALVVVAVALSVVSGGTSLAWAAALVGSSSLIIGALVLLAISITVQLGFQMLADVLGIEAAAILAVIAIVASVAVPSNVPVPIAGATLSDALMFSAVSLAKGIAAEAQETLEEIAGEAKELAEEQSELQKELDEAWDELKGDITINPLALVSWSSSVNSDVGETPDQFFFRTCHATNIGVRALDEIESFVNQSLQLEGLDPLNSIRI